ncbi:unknown [Mycoplasma sp. CAG:877]|nr:unknown [Mycoplasma sp. CAG:877]
MEKIDKKNEMVDRTNSDYVTLKKKRRQELKK